MIKKHKDELKNLKISREFSLLRSFKTHKPLKETKLSDIRGKEDSF